MPKKYLIVVAGPTAVGKTALAIDLAKHFDTDILSADSRQFYRGMDIGTAKPTVTELAAAKHYFIDNQDFTALYNVGDYEREAIKTLDSIFETKDIAIMVGGSGLYIKAVLEGLDSFPDISEATKQIVKTDFENHGLIYLQNKLQTLDPQYFTQVDIHNSSRVMRALEVCIESGLPYSSFLKKGETKRNFEPIYVLLDLNRAELYQRINDRVALMLELGLEQEAKNLHPYKDLNALQTVGYKEFFEYFDGHTTFDTAVELIKQHSRNYAKRQLTWFRKYGDWTTFSPTQTAAVIDFINKKIEEKS